MRVERGLDNVATCGHTGAMSRRKLRMRYPSQKAVSDALREVAALEAPPPLSVNVRTAKDRLSSLLEQAARGDEVLITSDGLPKAKLVAARAARKPFRVEWGLLRSGRVKAGAKLADELVREDRDGRP